jgi:hypothetical protein
MATLSVEGDQFREISELEITWVVRVPGLLGGVESGGASTVTETGMEIVEFPAASRAIAVN